MAVNLVKYNFKHQHGRSTYPTYVQKYENIKCQQLPLIQKMKLPIKLGSNAFLRYFIFFSFGRLQYDMDFYVHKKTDTFSLRQTKLSQLEPGQLVHYNLMQDILKFQQYLVGGVRLFVFIQIRWQPGQEESGVRDSRLGISKYLFSIYEKICSEYLLKVSPDSEKQQEPDHYPTFII